MFPGGEQRFCITDVGSTTTKAILFRKAGKWEFFRAEAATTVEKPHEDVTVGIVESLRALESASGEKLLEGGAPSVPYLSTSSAGGGLAMVVTGLVKEMTAEAADRTALGAGAVVLDVVAMNDGRTAYRKIEDLKRLRPDMLLLAGGFDGDAITGPVFLAELVVESALHPKLNPDAKLPVVYAGNRRAVEYVRHALGDQYLFRPVGNIMPAERVLAPGQAREAIHELFMEHVMSQAPGYETVKSWVSAPILPTPAAFAKILALVSHDLGVRTLAIDLGGATTDVFTIGRDDVQRTVSANLGMSYSIQNVAETAGVGPIGDLAGLDLSEAELWNHVGNKHINPTALPSSREDMRIEWATATRAVTEAVRAHLKVIGGTVDAPPSGRVDIGALLRFGRLGRAPGPTQAVPDYDLIIGSGGILSHSPRGAAAMMLIDGVRPRGKVELAADSAFMLPHLGALASVNPNLARELFHELAIVKLGTLISAAGDGGEAITVTIGGAGRAGREVLTVDGGQFASFPVAEGTDLRLVRHGGAEEIKERVTAGGGVCGLMVDARAAAIDSAAAALLPEDYAVPPRRAEKARRERLQRGVIRLRRELAIPGRVFVRVGERVETGTLVARSVRQFLRPFFLNVAQALGVSSESVSDYLLKKIGQDVRRDETIAEKPGTVFTRRAYRSPVDGRVEKILPSGTVVVREREESAQVLTAVEVAKELGIEPRRAKPYLKVEVGQEVDRGQWLAAITTTGDFRLCKSPVRGKVDRIDLAFGMVLIAPLLEELEVQAWLPGIVQQVTNRGCDVSTEGTTITGIWGSGGETAGLLSLDDIAEGRIVATHTADAGFMERCQSGGVAGVIAGGVNLVDVIEPNPEFTIVVTEGFGRHEMATELYDALAGHTGKVALLDGITQLRVGVRRPTVILPE